MKTLIVFLLIGSLNVATETNRLFCRNDDSSDLLLAPIAGEKLQQGHLCQLRWEGMNLAGVVKISIWSLETGKWTEVFKGLPIRLNSYEWLVEECFRPGSYRIKIESANEGGGGVISPFVTVVSGNHTDDIPGLEATIRLGSKAENVIDIK